MKKHKLLAHNSIMWPSRSDKFTTKCCYCLSTLVNMQKQLLNMYKNN